MCGTLFRIRRGVSSINVRDEKGLNDRHLSTGGNRPDSLTVDRHRRFYNETSQHQWLVRAELGKSSKILKIQNAISYMPRWDFVFSIFAKLRSIKISRFLIYICLFIYYRIYLYIMGHLPIQWETYHPMNSVRDIIAPIIMGSRAKIIQNTQNAKYRIQNSICRRRILCFTFFIFSRIFFSWDRRIYRRIQDVLPSYLMNAFIYSYGLSAITRKTVL